ncbi:MAG: DNA gyrase inhibitor YacG [Pseudomonadota bacterium]
MSCPICDSDATERYRPFCSKRCADIDLARWLGGVYTLDDEEDGTAADTPADPRPRRS